MKKVTALLTQALAIAGAGLAFAARASALDVRSWDQQIEGSKRFVVLSASNNEAVLDNKTQLVWERAAAAHARRAHDAGRPLTRLQRQATWRASLSECNGLRLT